MKTVLEWLQELDEPYRSEAIENCIKDIPYTGMMETEFLSEALGNSFIWETSPQGHKYWDKSSNKLLRKERG